MPAFKYNAQDPNGKLQKGIIEADSSRQARQKLRDKGFIVLNIDQSNKKNSEGKSKLSINTKDLALITRQLATLLQAGMPIEEVLAAVAEQTEPPKTKGLILSVRSKVLEGHSLAKSMGEFPEAFSELYCGTVAAGEKSGHLDVVLQRLADFTEKQLEMKLKVQQALIYPSVMVFVAIGIVGFLLEFVVPKMVAVYSSQQQELPGMTQFLISLSQGIASYGLYILIGTIIAIVIFRKTLKTNKTFKYNYHKFLLKLPIAGNTIKVANTARFARTFAILSSSGVPVLEAMKAASNLITNLPIKDAVTNATKQVREGAAINLSLKQTKYFQPMTIHLIASGENSGQLENMLERAADNQDSEISRLITTSLALFEPAIILIMGAIVLFIVLAVLLPIFQLDQLTV